MEFRLLGPLEVADGNRPFRLGGPKQRTVLVHLLLRPKQLVPADRLIDEVWGDDPPAAARNSLQAYVSHLRGALGSERLEGRSRGYVLNADPSEVDALRFEALLERARASVATDPTGAIHFYTEALALWRGPALDDLADQPSLRPEIARLEELRMAATEERIEAELGLGRHAELIPELETLAAGYPLREHLWGDLMVALYRSGRQGESLAAFQRAREILAEELGIDPSPELHQLQEQVLRQDPSLGLVGEPLRGYRLLEQVGQGALGAVYRAFQPQVGREVAVKVVHPKLANDPDFIRRFEVEAQLVAGLEHPRIVPLYDYWREPDGAYMVMRFLRGGSLQDALTRGPLELEAAVGVMGQITEALAAAHRRGIVHRDVRPANILFDEEGNAYLADFGIARDLADDHGSLTEGGPSPFAYCQSAEEIRGEPPIPQTDIYSLGLVLYEMLAGRHPYADVGPQGVLDEHMNALVPSLSLVRPDLGTGIDDVIGNATSKDPEARYADAPAFAEALRTALGTTLSRAVPAPAVQTRNPYKGLRPFLEADAPDFFGRDELVKRLVARMADDEGSRFLAIVGPSGSGKSSLLRAGLVPALRHGALPGSEGWFVVDMLPGSQPFAELQAALLRVAASPPPPNLLDQLGRDENALLRAVRWVLPNDDSELVLVIDQLEELFTLVEDGERRARFLDTLVAAATDPSSRVRMLATLRADFFDRPLLYRDFGELLSARTQAITPLSTTELELAISGPSGRVGIAVEPALVAEIAADVAGQPGALPLFQHTLAELFERRREGVLTAEAYREIGGVTGALTRRAEDIYASLEPAGKAAARQLFLRLVTLGEEGSEDTRRRALHTELIGLEVDRATMEGVIEAFGAHRLLSFDRDPVTRGPTVEVAHEALLGRWARLRGWIEAAREDVRTERRLAAAASEWGASGPDPSFLMRGGRLSQVEEWASTSGVAMGETEREYLAASVAEREAERSEDEGRRARERALERRSRVRLRALVAVFAVLAVVASGLTILTVDQRERARRETLVAGARGLAAASAANLDVDPELSILLAMEAVRTYQGAGVPVGSDAVQALHDAVETSRVLRTFAGSAGGAAQLSQDGRRLATTVVSSQGRGATDVAIWDARTGERLVAFPAHGSKILDLEFDADGSRVVTAGRDGTAVVWDAETGDRLVTVPVNGRRRAMSGASFSPDGTELATSGTDGILRIWDANTGDPVKEIPADPAPQGRLYGNEFSPDGTLVAVGDDQGRATVWDFRSGERVATFRGHGEDTGVNSVAFSPHGQRLATAGNDGRGVIWDLRTGRELVQLDGQPGHLYDIEFSPDGAWLATGGTDATARVWEADTGKQLLTLPGHRAPVRSLSFSPDGTRLATGSDDGTARIWNVSSRGSGEPLTIATGGGPNIVYSSDGTRLVIRAEGGRVRVFDAVSGRPIRTLTAPGEPELADVAVSPDGDRIAATSYPVGEEPAVAIWDARSGTVLRVLKPKSASGTATAMYSPDGRFLVSTTMDGTATVWDADTGELLRTLRHEPDAGPLGLNFSADGSRLVTTGFDGRVKVWDVPSWRPVGMPSRVERFPAWSANLSPDGSRLVTGLTDGSARIWDLTTGDELIRLAGHSGPVRDVEFGPGGTVVATASDEPTVRLWDPSSGQELLKLVATFPVTGIAFSPDGTRLAAIQDEGVIHVYTVGLAALMDLAHDRVTRGLTDDECHTYLQLERCPPGMSG